MQKFIFKTINSINQFCKNSLEDMGRFFIPILLATIILFFAICSKDLSNAISQIQESNSYMQTVATQIIETKDLNIELNDNLLKYKIIEDLNNYKVILYGPMLNSVSLTCSKDFSIKSMHSSDFLLIFSWLTIYVYYYGIKAIVKFILMILEFITKKITSITDNTIIDT